MAGLSRAVPYHRSMLDTTRGGWYFFQWPIMLAPEGGIYRHIYGISFKRKSTSKLIKGKNIVLAIVSVHTAVVVGGRVSTITEFFPMRVFVWTFTRKTTRKKMENRSLCLIMFVNKYSTRGKEWHFLDFSRGVCSRERYEDRRIRFRLDLKIWRFGPQYGLSMTEPRSVCKPPHEGIRVTCPFPCGAPFILDIQHFLLFSKAPEQHDSSRARAIWIFEYFNVLINGGFLTFEHVVPVLKYFGNK